MNEIAEILKSRSIKTAFPLELPEVEDIVNAQEEILIHIPVQFRDYLLHCSDVIYGQFEPVTIADPLSHTHLPEVAAEAWARGMPREYIPICKHDEQYYCVDEDDSIYLWSSEDQDPEPICDSIWAWVRDIWLGGNR